MVVLYRAISVAKKSVLVKESVVLKAKYSLFAIGLVAVLCGYATAEQAAWETVQKILMSSKDIIVLDGTEKGALRPQGEQEPAYGGLQNPALASGSTANKSGN